MLGLLHRRNQRRRVCSLPYAPDRNHQTTHCFRCSMQEARRSEWMMSMELELTLSIKESTVVVNCPLFSMCVVCRLWFSYSHPIRVFEYTSTIDISIHSTFYLANQTKPKLHSCNPKPLLNFLNVLVFSPSFNL